MGNVGTIGKVIKYLVICLILLSPSLLVVGKVFASSTGGYPWADAEVINQSTYDWGYRNCPTALARSQACGGSIRYKWGVKYYLSDPWLYDVRNCTSYVAWRVNRDYGISIPGWGNANNWDNAAANRFKVDKTPKPGSIAVWEGLYGHVAYVTKVYPNGMFEVDQYNNSGTGQFSHQLRRSADHFIHVKPATLHKPTKPKSPVQPAASKVSTAVKQAKERPAPPDIAGSLVPKPGIGDISPTSPLPSTREIDYLLEYSPKTEEINAFAIRHTHTKTGKIEINQSNLSDKNTKFQGTKVSSLDVRGEAQTKFALADYDRDKYLDLYVIKVDNTDSKRVEIVILDGHSDYQKQLFRQASSIGTHDYDTANYKVADKNNDGKLDIYKITNPTAKHKTKFEILDGAKQYTSVLNSWTSEETIPYDSSTNFYIGDHDGDGQPDVYHSYQKQEDKGRFSVEVYEAKSSLRIASRKLLIGDPSAKPTIVLPLIRIKDEVRED